METRYKVISKRRKRRTKGKNRGTAIILKDTKGLKKDFKEILCYNPNSSERIKIGDIVTLETKKKGSNRRKARNIISKIHESIENKRNDFLHKLSTHYITTYNMICIEKLDIKNMSRKERYWNKRNILDCSWGKFTSLLKFKAGSAGAKVIEVNPRNTTKTCSCCGAIKDMPITQRTYICECGNFLDRDINSARNILAQGLGIAESENIVSSSSVKQEAIPSTPEVLGYV